MIGFFRELVKEILSANIFVNMGRENEYFKKFDNCMSIKELRKRGTLVETMPKGTDFFLDVRKQYKDCLGTVLVRNIAGNTSHVYVAYRDHDDTIKYYDYPGYTKRDIRRMRKV